MKFKFKSKEVYIKYKSNINQQGLNIAIYGQAYSGERSSYKVWMQIERKGDYGLLSQPRSNNFKRRIR